MLPMLIIGIIITVIVVSMFITELDNADSSLFYMVMLTIGFSLILIYTYDQGKKEAAVNPSYKTQINYKINSEGKYIPCDTIIVKIR